jgi:hypothetical protein
LNAASSLRRLGVTKNSDLLAVNATLHRAFNRKIIVYRRTIPYLIG